ncbi:hypothetical protein Gotur_017174 [Gossypium turneri]
MDTLISIQKQAEHVVHFNPIFEESSLVNVTVKERVLEAKNHSTVVLKKSSILEPISKEIGGSVCPTEIKLPRVRAAELIASEIDRDSAKDLSQKKGELEEFSSTGHH